jgi:hypothetical protein
MPCRLAKKYRGYVKALGVYKARWREGVKIPYFCVYILNGWHHVHTINM